MIGNEATAEIVKADPHYDGMTMVVAPAEAHRRLQQLQAFVQSTMVRDVDYGVIPGTDKPTLYQPGAQKLAEVYGFSHHFEPIEAVKDWERGFFYFEYRCVLSSRRDGSVIGEGIGSCNSQESKYSGRWVTDAEVPQGMNKATLKQRTEAAWLFDNKLPAGTDKAKLPKQDRTSKKGIRYTVYQLVVTQYQIPNAEIASLVNTLQKMACKRAYVHAVIAATRSSGILTQDMEDIPEEAFGRVSAPQEPPHDAESAAFDDHSFSQFSKRSREYAEVPDIAAWRELGKAIVGDVKANLLTAEQVAKLHAIAKARAAELKPASPPKAGDPWDERADEGP